MPDDDSTPTIAPAVRSWAYIIGLIAVPVSAAFTTEAPLVSRILAAIGTGALAIAVGYRPTR